MKTNKRQMDVKTAEPLGPKFCIGPHVTPKVMNDQN